MPFEYPAIYSRQRPDEGPLFACFAAPAGDLLKWADVERLGHDNKGSQRIPSAARVRAIERFLEQHPRNIIPTSLIVALRLPDFSTPELGVCSTISIPDKSDADLAAGLIIDGQHRMYGVAAHDSNFLLNVVALINPEDEEIAFQFLVINSKASKVPTDHVKLLALNYSEDKLGERLRSARMTLGRYTLVGVVDGAPESPFYRAVDWPIEPYDSEGTRVELVRPASIEQALTSIVNKKLPYLADDDSLIEFFFAVWSAIHERWPDSWTAESKLLQKVGLVALTTYIIEDLTPLADRGGIDLGDPDSVRSEVDANILANLSEEFWHREWTAKSLDTSAGRQLVVDALRAIRWNMLRDAPWDAGVALVEGADEGA